MTDMMINNRIFYNALLGMVGCLFTVHAVAGTLPPPVDLNLAITGTIMLPAPCTISGTGGQGQITVDFGDSVSTSQVNGVNYRKPINYSVICEEGANNALALSIQGSSAGFGNGILKTSAANLGIKITHGVNSLPLNASLPFTLPNLPALYATPVKRLGATLRGQDFSAIATMKVFYQ